MTRPDRQARSPLVVIFVTVFVDLIGFGIIIPLLPFYAQTFGATAFAVGALSTCFSLMQFLFAPVWGRLSDRIGRRPIILGGLAGTSISYVAFGLADSLVMLFVARCLAGIAGANIPTAQAFIADVTSPENRAKGMGLIGAAFGLGFIFGPAIGGFMSQWGYRAPAFFAAALAGANFVVGLFVLPESRPPDAPDEGPRPGRLEQFRRALARPHLPVAMALFFIVLTAFSSFEATFALYAERAFGFDATRIGYLFAMVGVVLAIVQGVLVGKAARRFGEHRVVPVAILLLAASLAAVALAPTVLTMAIALCALAACFGFNQPSLLSVISKLADTRQQGGTLGVSQSLGSLARIIGPLWGGWVFDAFGIRVPILTGAALMVGAFVLSLVVFRGYRPEPASVPAGGR